MPSEGVQVGFLRSAGDVEYAVGADVVECAAVYYEEAVGRNVLCERTQHAASLQASGGNKVI